MSLHVAKACHRNRIPSEREADAGNAYISVRSSVSVCVCVCVDILLPHGTRSLVLSFLMSHELASSCHYELVLLLYQDLEREPCKLHMA